MKVDHLFNYLSGCFFSQRVNWGPDVKNKRKNQIKTNEIKEKSEEIFSAAGTQKGVYYAHTK